MTYTVIDQNTGIIFRRGVTADQLVAALRAAREAGYKPTFNKE